MSEYRTLSGDTWDIISLKNYQSELFTGQLVAANFEHRHTSIFPAGVVIEVPAISEEQLDETNLPPWRRS